MTLCARELTPPGPGAISVVRVEGQGALARVRELARAPRLAAGDLRLARLELAGESIDAALCACLSETVVELHLHGAPAIVGEVLAAFPAARSAGAPGLEERARELLASAPCDAAARILLDQVEGALRRELERLSTLPAAEARVRALELARRGAVARFALEPARVVLAGPVNAGKSTLFNALCGENAALVDAEPGTTRDVHSADVLVGSWPVRLFDTAGEREPEGGDAQAAVEREGQRRARTARARADVVLWLLPCSDPGAIAAPEGALDVRSLADRVACPPAGAISALADPAHARAEIGGRLRAHLGLPETPWRPGEAVPFEAPQRAALAAAADGSRDPGAVARALLGDLRVAPQPAPD